MRFLRQLHSSTSPSHEHALPSLLADVSISCKLLLQASQYAVCSTGVAKMKDWDKQDDSEADIADEGLQDFDSDSNA